MITLFFDIAAATLFFMMIMFGLMLVPVYFLLKKDIKSL